MIDAVIDRIRALNHDREYRALAEHVGVTSPIDLELLAYEQLSSVGHQARSIAGVQLRVVYELAFKLRWVEQVSMNPRLDARVRVALAGLLRSLCTESDMLPVVDSEATVLLEPAVLFHALLSRLRPWTPPMVLALEPDAVVDLLQLGIPDYLTPLLRQRFEDLWDLFHRLRLLPASSLGLPDEQPFCDAWWGQVIETALATEPLSPLPPAPPWAMQRWVTPWLACADPATRATSDHGRRTRTG